MFTIGFIGTRDGMTEIQRHTVLGLVLSANSRYETKIRGAHGDLIGADVQFHGICAYVGAPIVIRPPIIDSWRAWLGTERAIKLGSEFEGWPEIEVIHEPDDPFCSRRRIIAVSDVMIAAPVSSAEAEKGVTWAGIRQARRTRPQKPVFIVSPEGHIFVEQWTFLEKAPKWWELGGVEVLFSADNR